jgi:hypothetical protein
VTSKHVFVRFEVTALSSQYHFEFFCVPDAVEVISAADMGAAEEADTFLCAPPEKGRCRFCVTFSRVEAGGLYDADPDNILPPTPILLKLARQPRRLGAMFRFRQIPKRDTPIVERFVHVRLDR